MKKSIVGIFEKLTSNIQPNHDDVKLRRTLGATTSKCDKVVVSGGE